MKHLLFISLLFVGLVSGCSHAPAPSAVGSALSYKSGYSVQGTFRPNGSFNQTTLTTTKKYKFAITAVNGVTLENGAKKAQLTLDNPKDKTINLQYRFFWFDVNDMEIDSESNTWQTIQLASRVSRAVNSVSRSKEAYRFEAYVREL